MEHVLRAEKNHPTVRVPSQIFTCARFDSSGRTMRSFGILELLHKNSGMTLYYSIVLCYFLSVPFASFFGFVLIYHNGAG